MKVEYFKTYLGYWYWACGQVIYSGNYSRRRDAVRGFQRFCAAIKGVK